MSVPSLERRWRSCQSGNCAPHWLQPTPYVRRQESRIVSLCNWKRRNNITITPAEKLAEITMLTGM